MFWRELLDVYPDAKVVLSVRPPDRWYDSFRETVGAVISQRRPADLPEAFQPMFDVSDRIVRDRSFGADFDVSDKARVVASYEAHNAAVRAGVSPDRLLEFDVAQGWQPLCAFLGVPIPADEFPNVNDREQFKMLFGLDEPEPELTDEVWEETQDRFRDAAQTRRG
jgi:hypothetical protein